MADSGTPGSVLGRSLAIGVAGASDAQRAALPALATPASNATSTAAGLSAAAAGLPVDTPAAAASTRIKRSFSDTEAADSGVQCCKRGDGMPRDGVDYQSIPDEEYWRYNRYIDNCAARKRDPLEADDWQVMSERMRANNGGGYAFEREVRETLGVPIGTGSRPIRTADGFVPDLPVGEEYGVTDIKNVATLSDSAQLTAFHELAQERGLPFNLIVGPNTTHITAPLLDRVRGSGGTVNCYDPSVKSFKPLVLPPAGYWSK
jgi:hypothetical protein